MILCPKCGRVDFYEVTKYFKQMMYFDENDKIILTGEFVPYGTRTKPKCPKCDRDVKFFKDVEEE